MSDLRKAAQALVDRWDTPLWKDAPHTGVFIDALRDALAQPEQEPVAWRYLEDPWGANEYLITDDPNTAKGPGWTPLYTAPPQRKPLTEEEIDKVWFDAKGFESIVRAIERAHGIGENK